METTITAREFFLNTFNHDFLLPEEKETIITAMELYAKGKLKERDEKWKNAIEKGELTKDNLISI